MFVCTVPIYYYPNAPASIIVVIKKNAEIFAFFVYGPELLEPPVRSLYMRKTSLTSLVLVKIRSLDFCAFFFLFLGTLCMTLPPVNEDTVVIFVPCIVALIELRVLTELVSREIVQAQ